VHCADTVNILVDSSGSSFVDHLFSFMYVHSACSFCIRERPVYSRNRWMQCNHQGGMGVGGGVWFVRLFSSVLAVSRRTETPPFCSILSYPRKVTRTREQSRQSAVRSIRRRTVWLVIVSSAHAVEGQRLASCFSDGH
jgi:hypothetical protein